MNYGERENGIARQSSENNFVAHQETFANKKRGLNVIEAEPSARLWKLGRNSVSQDRKTKGRKFLKYEKSNKKKSRSSNAISQSLSNERKLDIESTPKTGKKKKTSPWLFNLHRRKKVSTMNSLHNHHSSCHGGLANYKSLQDHLWHKINFNSENHELCNTDRVFSSYCTTVGLNGCLPTPITLQSQADDAIQCFDSAMSSILCPLDTEPNSEEPNDCNLADVSAGYVIELIDKVLSGGLNLED